MSNAISIPKIPFQNQLAAVQKILQHYRGPYRYALLQASLQAGKTGTYHTLIRLMMEAGLIDHAVILCGSHEIELRDQFKADIHEWHGEMQRGKVRCVFRQDLKKKSSTLPSRRFLLVVDESHMVSKADQTVAGYLQRHGLDLSGTTPHMIQNEIYILSVSATPYAEWSDIRHKKCNPKARVVLNDGEGYVGLRHYWQSGRVHATWSLRDDEGDERFRQLLLDYHGQPKYAFIRLHHSTADADAIRNAVEWMGIPSIDFTTQYEKRNRGCPAFAMTRAKQDAIWDKHDVLVPCLEDAPSEFTIVFIDSRLRCGKRVCKTHVAFCWEGSRFTKTDTAMQSLWGRMCGYDVDLENAPHIYIPEILLKRQDPKKKVWSCEVERAMGMAIDIDGEELDQEIMPRIAANILRQRIQNRARRGNRDAGEVYPCVPIRMQLRNAEYEHLHRHQGEDREIKALCLRYFMDHFEELMGPHNRMLTDEQREEIRMCMDDMAAEGTHVRHFQGSSNQNHHRAIIKGYQTCTASSEHVSYFPFVTFCPTYEGYQAYGDVYATPGDVYVIFYTITKGLFERVDLFSRVSVAMSDTYFRPLIPLPADLYDPPSIMMISFSPMIYYDPAAFERQFKSWIRNARNMMADGLMVSHECNTMANGEPLLLSREVYPPLELAALFARIETDMAVRIERTLAVPRRGWRQHHGFARFRWVEA